MAFPVSLFQIFNSQPGIVFQGFEILMTQEFFDVVEIGTSSNQLGSAAAPERARRNLDFQPCGFGLALHDSPERMIRHSPSRMIQEQRWLVCLLE